MVRGLLTDSEWAFFKSFVIDEGRSGVAHPPTTVACWMRCSGSLAPLALAGPAQRTRAIVRAHYCAAKAKGGLASKVWGAREGASRPRYMSGRMQGGCPLAS